MMTSGPLSSIKHQSLESNSTESADSDLYNMNRSGRILVQRDYHVKYDSDETLRGLDMVHAK